MSTVLSIPAYTQFLQPVKRFTATFNNPTLNKYDFGVAGNTDQPFLQVKKQYLYLFDTFSFSAQMIEGVFLKAVDDDSNGNPSTLISIRIPSQNNKLLYREKIPVINYVDNSETQYYAYSQQDESLVISFEGVLTQVDELIGEVTVKAQLTCNVYEIRNKNWIDNFLDRTKHGQSVNLIGGGIE